MTYSTSVLTPYEKNIVEGDVNEYTTSNIFIDSEDIAQSREPTVCGLTIDEIYRLKDVIRHLKEDNAALKKALEGFIGRAV